MSVNPYQSPKSAFEEPAVTGGRRRRALWMLRAVFVILLLPAIYNYCCFESRQFARFGIGLHSRSLIRTINVLAFLICGALICFAGLPVLESISGLIRMLFAPKTDSGAWKDVLYASLERAVLLSIPGAVLWAIWVFGFYQLNADFMTISYAIGIPAHILGACFYLPLLHGWYKLARGGSSWEESN